MDLFKLIVIIICIFSIGFGVAFVCYLVFVERAYKSKAWRMPVIRDGKPTKYGWVVRHPERLVLGNNTDIGAFTYIQAEYGVEIENDVQIGSHVSIYSKNTIDGTHGKIFIKSNAKIGSGTVILPKFDNTELVIGKNSKIGALSLIKNDIPSGCLACGIPARVMGVL